MTVGAEERGETPNFLCAIYLLMGVGGAVLLVDGSMRGEPRHRMAACVLGAGLLLLPLLSLIPLAWLRRLVRGLTLSGGTLVVLLVGLEVLVRAMDLPAFTRTELRFDPVLGHAHVPNKGRLDALGFRNPGVPEVAKVVCVGDSQTYGNNIEADQTYAAVLGQLLGENVYNMSLGGYGPLQYLTLGKDALERFSPDVLVVGFYFGNDLPDAFRFASLEAWAHLRDDALDYPPLDEMGHGDHRSLNLGMGIIDGVMSRSRVLSTLGDRIKLRIKLSKYGQSLSQGESGPGGFDDPEIGTRFTPDFRVGCLDLDRPAIARGLENTRHCLGELGQACHGAGTRPILLLIPNKEAIYHRFLVGAGKPRSKALDRLAEEESITRAAMVEIAQASGFELVDPTEALAAELARGVPVFPRDADAHLGPRGAEIAALAIQAVIEAAPSRRPQSK